MRKRVCRKEKVRKHVKFPSAAEEGYPSLLQTEYENQKSSIRATRLMKNTWPYW